MLRSVFLCSSLRALALSACLLGLSACSEMSTVSPGRGVEREIGPLAKVYPQGASARMDRHGLWRGMEGEKVVWEVRYTRGVPTGPYREWNEAGELVATWPYDWDGKLTSWARWFDGTEPSFKHEFKEEAAQPAFDPIGDADGFRQWAEAQAASLPQG